MHTTLTAREENIILQHKFDDRPLRKIAEDLGISRERVRQIEARILAKLIPALRTHEPLVCLNHLLPDTRDLADKSVRG